VSGSVFERAVADGTGAKKEDELAEDEKPTMVHEEFLGSRS
jgi:hypothetical protein